MPPEANQPLPIDPHLPALLDALRARGAVVLTAAPGAGKTTRAPRAMLEAEWGTRGEILVLEPRRIAARLAARRVAQEIGEEVGGRVGYQVRFEDRTGPRTRLIFLTEGILPRRLAADPELRGVAAVVLDEFHERGLDGDFCLAALRRLRRGARPDLAVVVMSATLDAAPAAAFLDAASIEAPGRAHPVAIEHDRLPDDRPLERRVAASAERLIDGEERGDLLVFLPGAAEIRRAAEALAPLAERRGLLVAPLHGDLPPEEQDRAVAPNERRKVILATNVAETSITIDGVTAVVDGGLKRAAGHSPWSGLPTRSTAPISQASAEQRAGRAGRTGPGRCLRLYTAHDLACRPRFDAPEIERADLADLALRVAASGGAAGLEWLSPPREEAWRAAEELLRRLGALDEEGRLTRVGRALARLPVHPRAARVALAAAERGAASRGAALAALLGERALRLEARAFGGDGAASRSGPSDLLEELDALDVAERAGMRADALRREGIDAGAARRAARARDQLLRLMPRALADARRGKGNGAEGPEAEADEPLLRALLAGFPDRVARRRAAGSAEVLLAGGGAARLAPTSVVQRAEFLVALDAEERRGRGVVVRAASAVEPDWLLEMYPGRIAARATVRFDARRERVEETEELVYDGLALDAAPRGGAPSAAAEQALFDAARGRGIDAFCDPGEAARLRRRIELAAAADARVAPLDDARLEAALRALCVGRRSFEELRAADLLGELRRGLGADARAALERAAPDAVRLPDGRTLRIEYEAGRPPWVASYLQDFFGLAEAPRVGGAPLVVHLWAPSRRPLQVTTDLASFWANHYPRLRQELMRRYPKHAWPEDPLAAPPRRFRRDHPR